ncbi:probable gamma-secretase subunit PEN-2 [Impatiens glandulifera]|uniref:probable gamma-secretase subunit PEN-2 n=1 Tax=Impatiens glandulifera TaxID=253017 RepID=UPI001FB0816D|nr:probable gamma-secretase subunit PEN-2 [Impatiens glandulifera]
MESSQNSTETVGRVLPVTNTNNRGYNPIASQRQQQWPTIDGPLGLSVDDSVSYARRFFKFGFLLLPFLWGVNCFYFWPVLRNSSSFPQIRRYVVGSAIGFFVFTTLLSSWALTFSIGGPKLFGSVWDEIVMYNVAEKYGLTGWM